MSTGPLSEPLPTITMATQSDIHTLTKACLGREDDDIAFIPPGFVNVVGQLLDEFPYDNNFVVNALEPLPLLLPLPFLTPSFLSLSHSGRTTT